MKKLKSDFLKLFIVTGLLMTFPFCFTKNNTPIIIRKDNPPDPQPDQPHIMKNFQQISIPATVNLNENY